jgi:hypothetical protein
MILSRLISSAGFLDAVIVNFALGLEADVAAVPDVSTLTLVGDCCPLSDAAHSISLSEPADAILLG